jgi:spermidine/putrescine transport system ATP-binding protein
MSLSDRIAVMNNGKIEQIGTPAEIYENPKTKFVASFIGDTNFFEGKVRSCIDSEYYKIDMNGLGEFPAYCDKKLDAGAKVTVSIRPEKFEIFAKQPYDNLNMCEGEVEDIVYQGSQTRYWVRVKEHRINIVMQHNRCALDFKQPTWGDKVWIAWHRDDVTVLESNSPD